MPSAKPPEPCAACILAVTTLTVERVVPCTVCGMLWAFGWSPMDAALNTPAQRQQRLRIMQGDSR